MSTATATRPATLHGLADDALLDLMAAAQETGDTGTQAAIVAELARQDTAREYWRQVNARTTALKAEWREAAYAQYLAAEAELKGELVRRDSRIADPFDLWAGPDRFAMAHSSEELRLWWTNPAHPRVTVTQYMAQHAAAAATYRDDMERAAMDAAAVTEGSNADEVVGPVEPAPVRRDASAGREDAAVRQDGQRDDVSGPDAGRAGAGPVAGPGPAGNAGHVRGPAVTRDSEDGARVDVTRGGVPAGYAFRTQVKAGGFNRTAWWGVRADGSMFLRPDKRAAVAAVLAG
jgi:hypothetical protein